MSTIVSVASLGLQIVAILSYTFKVLKNVLPN
jgi:hypothetical protein